MTTANRNAIPEISFEADANLVEALIEDLQNEQKALVKADLDTIERIIDQRVELLQALGEAAKQRYAALSAAGFEANEKGMAKWLELGHGKVMDTAWMEFQKKLAQAKELNRINGILINKHFQRNQEKLDAIQGKATNATQFYGKNGQTHGAHSSRTSFAV
ncbi:MULTISPECIES: flagellar protein FlgN [unclassified Methylophilus]|uniref:Flagella synthesis protein FlgN n=1 Tax=Methylophilus glucosoxydans TaxID=752553 RepID=A0ABW3GKX9_9PROT|nr:MULTISPECIES: flagellar protein FlgN [unclassified Methylophilus]MBF5038129.1 flagellar protein FlgN [Methylophilus sp. 13]MDF0376681.1 flagellar protein FlgN [Methylophilus sp. YYY-1]MDT7850579.1 flagellar protein FlgN [Methylophilus sp. VKM B-3414]BEV07904.1 flagellar protein FlgN [Methylophilus sp. DW102]